MNRVLGPCFLVSVESRICTKNYQVLARLATEASVKKEFECLPETEYRIGIGFYMREKRIGGLEVMVSRLRILGCRDPNLVSIPYVLQTEYFNRRPGSPARFHLVFFTLHHISCRLF